MIHTSRARVLHTQRPQFSLTVEAETVPFQPCSLTLEFTLRLENGDVLQRYVAVHETELGGLEELLREEVADATRSAGDYVSGRLDLAGSAAPE